MTQQNAILDRLAALDTNTVSDALDFLGLPGATYGISALINKRKNPKIKTSAPDDDPKFLRDLAERLAKEAEEEKKRESGEEPNKDNPLG